MVQDFGEGVIIPAFSDLHVHAPQYPQRALAMDLLLYDWLNQYTFPLEARYADPAFAHAVYDAFTEDLIANGTFHACIFGTIHPEGRELGIKAGANVVMPNLSPASVRKKYALYDNKICTGDESAECRRCLEIRMKSIGYEVVTARGDIKPIQ